MRTASLLVVPVLLATAAIAERAHATSTGSIDRHGAEQAVDVIVVTATRPTGAAVAAPAATIARRTTDLLAAPTDAATLDRASVMPSKNKLFALATESAREAIDNSEISLGLPVEGS